MNGKQIPFIKSVLEMVVKGDFLYSIISTEFDFE